MDDAVKRAIIDAVRREPFARSLKMELVALEDGRSVVKMANDPSTMSNIYDRTHGGALFGLIDEAFETAAQTGGTVAVALNVNITYIASPKPDAVLQAEARRISQTRKTALYEIKVTDQHETLIAACQALAYDTGKPIPFVENG